MADRDMAAIRRAIPWHQWDGVGGVIARSRNENRSSAAPIGEDVARLRQDGYLPLGKSAADAEEMRWYFERQPHHHGHHVFSTGNPYFHGYRPDQVLRCPGLLDLFNSATVLEPVHDFLECIPTLYSVNAWWSLPAPNAEPQVEHVQHWHRDTDDWRFVTLFMYLTDTDEKSGAMQVVPGSHLKPPFPPDIDATAATLSGPVGSMFLVNTMALHRGLPPVDKARLIVWARYGLGPNTNSMDLEQGPISRQLIPCGLRDTKLRRYVNRLVVDFDRGPI